MTLFDLDPPAQAHSDTSQAAAVAAKPSAETQRAKVCTLLEDCWLGLTDEEMQDLLHMNPSTQRPRRVELVRAGLVEDSGRRRSTASGRQAVVWQRVDGE